jgi:hypothetical protein
MKKNTIFLVLILLVIGQNTVSGQSKPTTLKPAINCLGSALLVLSGGMLTSYLMEDGAKNTLQDENEGALALLNSKLKNAGNNNTIILEANANHTKNMATNMENYDKQMKTVFGVKIAVVSVVAVLSIVGLSVMPESNGSVTVARTKNTKIGITSNGPEIGLCLTF